MEGQPVQKSEDAGDYICNYIYYQSLEKCQGCDDISTLFVHVPTFATLSEEKQQQCLYKLLEGLRAVNN